MHGVVHDPIPHREQPIFSMPVTPRLQLFVKFEYFLLKIKLEPGTLATKTPAMGQRRLRRTEQVLHARDLVIHMA